MIDSKHSVGVSPRQALTKAGQADWAIVGETRTCGGCLFWMLQRARDREAICAKARAMMGLRRTSKVPHNAIACKYFEAREAAQ